LDTSILKTYCAHSRTFGKQSGPALGVVLTWPILLIAHSMKQLPVEHWGRKLNPEWTLCAD
jgi:hypothetical protein